jgi:hypothetical protein
MLQTTPFHRESYSRLILGVIIQFYQRCSDKFQELVSSSAPGDSMLEPQVALAAQWAQRAELVPCLTELQNTLVCIMWSFTAVIVTRPIFYRKKIYLNSNSFGAKKRT